MMNVKCNLFELRKKKNLRQTELSKLTGISQKALSELETGKSKGISFSTMAKLCEVLGSNISDLFEMTSENEEFDINISVVEKPTCSFCSRKENEVDILIVGKPSKEKEKSKVYICSDCIKRCNNLVQNNK